jgi:NAD+ kinase
MPGTRRIAFVASDSPEARAAERELVDRYGYHTLADADTVVALGGDGLMLETLHRVLPGG